MSPSDEFPADGISTTPASFDAREGAQPDTWILSVSGEVDVATSPDLRRELHALLDQGRGVVVLDLGATTFMDSSGLGVLVGALRRCKQEGRDDTIVLEGLQEPVRKVFDITGLAELFTIR